MLNHNEITNLVQKTFVGSDTANFMCPVILVKFKRWQRYQNRYELTRIIRSIRMSHNDDVPQWEPNIIKSKHGHESTLDCSVFDEISADRTLSFIAQRASKMKKYKVDPWPCFDWYFWFVIVAHHYCDSFGALERYSHLAAWIRATEHEIKHVKEMLL